MPKKFSVIIPAHNPDPVLLRRLLDSLNHARKEHDVQIIVVGNGEELPVREGTQGMDAEIHFINIPSVCRARNEGFDYATGDCILFLDADDYVEETIFDKLEQAEEADITVFGFYKWKDGNREEIIPQPVDFDTFVTTADGGGVCWNKLYRKEFINKNVLLFDPQLRLAEDLLFNCQCAIHHPTVSFIQEPLHNYIVTDGSASQKFKPDIKDQYLLAMNKISRLPIENKEALYLTHLIYTVLKYTYHPGNPGKNKDELKELMETEPYADIFHTDTFVPEGKANKAFYQLLKHHIWPGLQLAAMAYWRL